jgi:hypothetical protein
MKMLIEILWQLKVLINYDSQIILIEMAMGTNLSVLGFSDPYPPKKNSFMGYLFSVMGRDFISNLNPSGNPS